MSVREGLVVNAANLCLGALIYGGLTAEAAATGGAALSGLFGLGARVGERHRSCRQVVRDCIRDRLGRDFAALAGSPEHRADWERAEAILGGEAGPPLDRLAGTAFDDAGFETAAVRAILDGLPFDDHERRDGALAFRIVETAVSEGVAAARRAPDFNSILADDVTIRLAREMAGARTAAEAARDAAHETRKEVADFRAEVGAKLELLLADDATGSLSRDDFEDLARVFEQGEPERLSERALRDFVFEKARGWRKLKDRSAAIDPRTAELGALKAAATEAVERGDLAEVESLLSRVDAVETGIAAQTKELRAENALLRGRAEEACAMFSAAADGFASLDAVEPARWRVDYGTRLSAHGLRFGGAGLECAAQMLRDALRRVSEDEDGELWGALQHNLGAALQEQGARLGGAAGAALLGEAVDAYRAALRVRSGTGRREDWAMTQDNLGTALQRQGARLGGRDGAALLDEAVDAYRAALRVRAGAAHYADWAATKNNLGTALRARGERLDGEAGAALLGEAVDAYRAALRVRTKTKHLEDWATTRNNLGNALRARGERLGGEAGAALLRKAVDAVRAALPAHKEEEHPVDWATTRNNLGNALRARGERLEGQAGAALLGEAVDAFRAALRVRKEKQHPVDWAMTRNNLGNALRLLGARLGGEAGAALLDEAVDACGAALRVRTEAEHPVDWAMTTENLGLAHEARAETAACADPRAELARAAACFEAALRVFDPEHMPFNHRKAAEALARARRKLGPPG